MEKSVKSVKFVPNPEREGFLEFFKFWKPKQIAIEVTTTGKKKNDFRLDNSCPKCVL